MSNKHAHVLECCEIEIICKITKRLFFFTNQPLKMSKLYTISMIKLNTGVYNKKMNLAAVLLGLGLITIQYYHQSP